jgi:4-hydroxy-3-polyprenylbenzoate decarboxylase
MPGSLSEIPRRLVVGISGASGARLGIRLLEVARGLGLETHLVISAAGQHTIAQETDWQVSQVLALASFHYDDRAIEAAVASGSFRTHGMVVIPCSIKTLSAVANSYASTLISRAADVTLKEGRPLMLVVRETPLHLGHLRLMQQAAEAGAVIFPPVPAFYARPRTVEQLIDNTVGRVLARLGFDNDLYTEWDGETG